MLAAAPEVVPLLAPKTVNQLHSHPNIAGITVAMATGHVIACNLLEVSTSQDFTFTYQMCQKAKMYRHTKAPIGTFANPDARFDHIHLNILRPLPASINNKYLLTCIDRFTHWPEAIPIPDIMAETVARAFIRRWVSTFGAPSTVTTDHGSQFE